MPTKMKTVPVGSKTTDSDIESEIDVRRPCPPALLKAIRQLIRFDPAIGRNDEVAIFLSEHDGEAFEQWVVDPLLGTITREKSN